MNLQKWISTYFNRIPRDKKTNGSGRHCLARNMPVPPSCELLEERALFSAAPILGYVQTNLVSNTPGMALITDPRLVDPWDVNFPQEPGVYPPVVVADQGVGVATSY
jgi:hypothetical protein